MTVINESGLYSLILSKQAAERKEVQTLGYIGGKLPAVRQTGAYMTAETDIKNGDVSRYFVCELVRLRDSSRSNS